MSECGSKLIVLNRTEINFPRKGDFFFYSSMNNRRFPRLQEVICIYSEFHLTCRFEVPGCTENPRPNQEAIPKNITIFE